MEENIVLQSLLELCAQGNSNLELAVRIIRRKNKRLALLERQTKVMKKEPETIGFVHEINEMPNDIFYSHFGMGKATFDRLLSLLNCSYKKAETGRPGIDLRVALLITLYKLSNKNSFLEVCERFNVAQGASYRVFVNCIQMIANQKQLIHFPNTEESHRKLVEGFETLMSRSFPNVMGCIGNTHIRIPQPPHENANYYNRDRSYSIIAQAVADSKMKFLDVFVGHPGSCHTASVWHDSSLKCAIISERIPFSHTNHLLGDISYPLESYLMVPYRDNGYLTAAQTNFNNILNSTRVRFELALKILKDKFKILNYLYIRDIKLAKKIILSCFILHNFIIDTEGVPDIAVNEEDCSQSNDIPCDDNPSQQAIAKREMLTTLLST